MKGWDDGRKRGKWFYYLRINFLYIYFPLGGLGLIIIIVMQTVYIGHSSQPKKEIDNNTIDRTFITLV